MVITVVGSTGTIGRELIRLLSESGTPTRAVFRDPRKLHSVPGIVWVQADLHDVSVLEPVLAGTTRLFLLTDNQAGFGELQIRILQAAERLGVEHVVKLSALGASDHSRSWIAREHWQVEQVLQALTTTWTILRPHAFMQNWLGELAESVRRHSVIESPIGDGRVPFIDTRDIASVALDALLRPHAHAGHRYFLTGGEAIGFADIAAVLGELTGRRVTYRPISLEEERARMERAGVPALQMDAMLAISAYQRAGGPTSIVSDKVERILGRRPRTVRDFLRDHVDRFIDESAREVGAEPLATQGILALRA
jgi:NAD(P)H dehydrogenase (quinone)